MILAHIADRALNRPLLVTPDKAQVIMSVLAGRIGINVPEATRFEGTPFAPGKRPKTYNVTAGGVGIISIVGSLVNRGAWIGANSGLVSYEGIQHQLKAVAVDADVRSVILDLHTPGGEAVGAFETAALVRQLATVKRTVAVVNGMAASAGYAIASGATEIVTTETGVSGSIGVVLLHADFSGKLEKDGIKPTLIFAGAHKVDGNPFEALPPEVRDDLQAEVDAFYSLFLKTVGQGRGARLTAAAARATEARALIGQAAVAAGLADRLGSFESELVDLERLAAPPPRRVIAPPARITASDRLGSGLVAARAAGEEQAFARGVAEGRAAVWARMDTALAAPEVQVSSARRRMALDLLAETASSAERVVEFVAKHVPVEPKAVGHNVAAFRKE